MEQQKGLKSILLDVLGLQTDTAAAQLAQPHAEQQQEETAVSAGGGDAVEEADPAGQQLQQQQEADVFAARLASITHQYESDAAAARDAQQYLQEAHKQARQKELELLVAADAAYTPAWRQTGIPSKPSQLQLDQTVLSGSRLLNSNAIITAQQQWQQQEVLQPPVAYAYCDKTAAPHYLQVTGNQKVRQTITAARLAAVKSPTQHLPQLEQQQQQQQSKQRAGTGGRQQQVRSKQQQVEELPANQPQQLNVCRNPQPPTAAKGRHQQSPAAAAAAAAASVTAAAAAKKAGAGRVPWSQLPADEAADKVAAAAARYKAMAAIMTPEQRELEERIIKRMHQRLSFLCNPRYAASTAPAPAMALRGSSAAHKQRHNAPDVSSKDSSSSRGSQRAGGAQVSPEQAGFAVVPVQGALFDSYEPGNAYMQTLQLQNAGLVMRQLRLLPPASQYFQVSVPRFPLGSSALAPGMCAEVDVWFTPDSLGDYEDCFTVETPGGSFAVQLTGRRPAPQLTLPAVLEVGTVLAGHTRSRTFEFVNQGGEGRFLLLPAEQWAATLAQHGAHKHPCTPENQLPTAAVSYGPFSISPSYLDLPAGAAGVLAVDFSPQHPGDVAEDFVLVCDNCTASALRVEGRGGQVQVEVVGLDSREWLPQDAQMPLWFGQACPGSSNRRQLRVRNASDLPFPFAVAVLESAPHASGSAAAFTVSPATGVLQAGSEQELTVEFAPMTVSAYAAVLSLAVQRSGDAGLLSITQWGQDGTAIVDLAAARARQGGAHSSSAAGASLGCVDVSSSNQRVCGSGSTADCADHTGAVEASTDAGQGADAAFCSYEGLQGSWPESSDWECVTEVAVEGVGCPVRVTVQPAATLRLPGALTVGDEASLPLQLCNHDAAAAAAAHFFVAPVTGPEAASAAAHVVLQPSQGVVPANGVLDLVAHFTGLSAGMHLQDLVLRVLHGEDLHLQVQVEVLQVKVAPSCHTLDFGVLCVGCSATQALELSNTAAHSSCTWSLQELDTQMCVPRTEVQFQPSSGTLAPSLSCSTAVTVTGRSEGSHKLLLRLSSNSVACSACGTNAAKQLLGAATQQPQCSCSCCAEVIQVLVTVSSPKVSLSRYRLPLKNVYSGVPQTHSLSMTNTSSLPLTFSWAVKQLPHGQYLQLMQQLLALHQLADTATKGCGQPAAGPALSSSNSSIIGGSSSDDCGAQHQAGQLLLSVAPCTGQLQPGQSVRLQLRLQPLAVGPVALLCCCQVPAMSQLVGLLVTGEVGGLQVSYQIITPEELVSQQQQEQQQRQLQQLKQARRSSSPTGHQSNSLPSRGASAASNASHTRKPHASFAVSVQDSAVSAPAPPNAASAANIAGTADASAQAQGGVAAGNRDAEKLLAADFGVVQLHQPAELLLRVTNLTSIPSMVTAWMGHFAAHAAPHSQATAVPSAGRACSSAGMWVGRVDSEGACMPEQPAGVVASAAGRTSRSPVHSAASQQAAGSASRSSSPCSQALSRHSRQTHSASHRGAAGPAAQLSAASVAAKLSRTDPGSYTGTRAHSSASIPADALIKTLTSISKLSTQGQALDGSSSSHCFGATNLASTSMGSRPYSNSMSSGSGSGGSSGGSSLVLKGPFRAFAGNAMMAARQAAAAAAAALGAGSAGCAVQLLPDALELPGWGSCLLRLQAFNNLPGTYCDTLYVQVGELPPQRIPVALQVQGSPLVISKQRVQVQGSEVLHTLLHQQMQYRPMLPAPQLAPAAAAVAAAVDATCGSRDSESSSRSASELLGAVSSSRAGGSSASTTSSSSSRTAVALDFGTVPAGVEVQHILFVSNTGALPMQLEWTCLKAAAPGGNTAARCSNTDCQDPAAAGGVCAPLAEQEAQSNQGCTAEGASADTASGPTGASSSSRPGGDTQASSAGAPVGTTTATAAAVGASGAGAGGHKAAAGQARAAVNGPAAQSVAAGPQQQQDQQQQQQQAGLDPADAAEVSDPAAAAVEESAAFVVESCESLLPPGGPSSLLQTMQQQLSPLGKHAERVAMPNLLQNPGGPQTAESGGSSSGGSSSSSAASMFRVAPETCVIQPGQQQQLVVTFVSNEPTPSQHFVLCGKQTLCGRTLESTQPSSSGDGDRLRLHLLPSSTCVGSQKDAAAAEQALRCCISGGFHPHAGPPPSSLPTLTVSLSAQAALPQLTPAEPDSLTWSCSRAHDPGTHASYAQVATLTNTTGFPLVFGMSVSGPFQLLSAVPSVKQDLRTFRGLLGSSSLEASQHTSKLLLLPPRESVKVTVLFDPAAAASDSSTPVAPAVRLSAAGMDLPGGARQQTLTEPVMQTGAQTNSLVKPGGSEKPGQTQHHGALVVAYTSGHQQVLPMQALLVQPELLVTPQTGLDFGTVHPAAPRTLQLTLTNPTEAEAAWAAVVQDLSVSTAAGTASEAQQLEGAVAGSAAAFSVTPEQGTLLGRGLGMPAQCRLQVVFAPHCSGLFAAELHLQLHQGKEVVLQLRGSGVHTEAAELRAAYDL